MGEDVRGVCCVSRCIDEIVCEYIPSCPPFMCFITKIIDIKEQIMGQPNYIDTFRYSKCFFCMTFPLNERNKNICPIYSLIKIDDISGMYLNVCDPILLIILRQLLMKLKKVRAFATISNSNITYYWTRKTY